MPNPPWINWYQWPCLQSQDVRGPSALGVRPYLLLSNEYWRRSEQALVEGNQRGRHSTKIANTLVPQTSANIVNLTETYGTEINSVKYLRVDSRAKLPWKATSGSAVYELFTVDDHPVPPCSRLLNPAGHSYEIPFHTCGRIASGFGLSGKNLLDIAARVIDNNYGGVLKVLLHICCNLLLQSTPEWAMTQVLFLPLCQLPTVKVDSLFEILGGPNGLGSTNIDTVISEVIQPLLVTGGPPSVTFLSVRPSKTTIRPNSPDGPAAHLIIDSRFNILLVFLELLEQLRPPPKPGEEQHIGITKVTGPSSKAQYASFKLRFETNLVSMRIEAYIARDTNAPLKLGSDFMGQRSLTNPQKSSTISLQLSTSGHSILLGSSADSTLLDVQALQAWARTIQDLKDSCNRNRQRVPNNREQWHSKTIPPSTIRKLEVRTSRSIAVAPIFTPYNKQAGGIDNSTFIDFVDSPAVQCLHITNDTDTPIQFLRSDMIGIIKFNHSYHSKPPDGPSQVQRIFNVITPILQDQKDKDNTSEKQQYRCPQAELPYRSVLAEVPRHKDVLSVELLFSLDPNLRLLMSQGVKLKDVIFEYRISPQKNSATVSMQYYYASPVQCTDIDKQINKWSTQGVIRESDSPQETLVIEVHRYRK
jgi:dUTPase